VKGVIMTLIKHEIKANLKTLLIWGLTVGGMNFLMMLIFPSVKEQMAGMVEMYANMGSFSQAFGMDKINFTTPLGFYGIEAGAVLSLGGSMFAAILGTGMLAKEEGAHTAEFLFTTPHTRTYHIALKAVALGLLVLLFNLLAIGFGYGSFLAINETLEGNEFALYHLAQLCMHLQIAYLCFAVSAVLKRSAMGLGIGLAILLYFVQIFVNISDKVEFLKYFTPFYYSDAAEIFYSGELQLNLMFIGGITTILFLVFGFTYYRKKDLL